MNITKRVLAFLLVLFLMFGNVTPAMATGLETEETVAAPETQAEAPVEETPAEPADAVLTAAPSTPHEIVDAAYALGEGEVLEGTYTLTGKIISVDTAYNATYSNITVTIVVEGRETKPIQCFRLKGTGADTLAVGDTITVTGSLKNYYGTIEFDQGCTLDAVVKAEPEVTEPGEAPDATMTFVAGNRVEWDTEHQVWQCDGITLTNNKGGSTSNVADYTDPARFYKGSSIKIEYPGMTKIVFTCTGGAKYVLAEGDIAALGAVTTDGFSVTLELKDAADAVEFVAASNQVRFSKIEVYSTGTAVNPGEPDPTEPAPTEPETPEVVIGVVNADNLNVRAEPSVDSAVVAQLPINTVVEILEQKTADGIVWGRISSGWINMNFVTIVDEVPEQPTEPDPTEPEVTEPEVENTHEYLKFAIASHRISYSAEQQVWKNGDLVLTNDKGDSTADIYDIVAKGYGEVRLYQGSNVKIEFPNMFMIVFYVDDYKDTYTDALIDSISHLGTVTWEPHPDGSVVYLNLAEPVDSITYTAAAQHRLLELDVYGTAEDPDEPAPDEPAPTEPDPTEPEVTEPAPSEPSNDEIKPGVAYKFGMVQENVGTDVYYLDGNMNGYYMNTTTDSSAAVDVYVEVVDGGYHFYTMNNGAIMYINMVVSGTHVNGAFEATASTVYTYDNDKDTLIANIDGADYWFGTRNDKTYTTMGPCKVEYNGFYGKFYEVTAEEPAPSEPAPTEPEPTEPEPTEPEVTEPAEDAIEAGVAYKFGMVQENVGTDVYYLNGAMNGYYMDTTTDVSAAADVYVEVTDGGYYFYAMVNGAKLYINMVVSGTYVNGAFEENASTVYTYDNDKGTLIANVNNANYWFGTRNDKTYTTMGPCKVEYNGFYGKFYDVTPEEPTPSEPAPTEPEVTEPAEPEETPAAVLDFSTDANRISFSSEQQVWSANGITVTNNKADSTSNVADYTNPVRFYKGSSILIEYPNMTKLVITTSGEKYATPMVEDLAPYGEVIIDGAVVTLELMEPMGAIEWITSAQIRFSKLEVYEFVDPTLGTEENPIMVNFTMNDTYTEGYATVTVPARTTRYFQAFGIGGMLLSINGGEGQLLEGNPRMPVVFTIVNDTDVDWEYALTVSYPVGSQMNPASLNVYTVGENEEYEGDNQIWVEADNWNGYIYNWTAPMAGELTITMEDGFAGWAYSIYNMNTYEMTETHYSCDLPAVNSETITVNAGDVIQVMVNTCGDDTATIPGGLVTFRATYNKVYGTEENPLEIDNLLVWNEDWTEATATIVVPAHTLYWIRTWQNGKQVTVDVGGETYGPVLLEDPEFDGILLTADNTTDEELVYTFHFSFPPAPVGSWDNPAELVLGENSCEIEENSWSGYLYQWTATERGWLTIAVAEGVASWNYQINNLTQGIYGDPFDSINTPDMTSQTIEVRAGDVIQVQINTAMDYEIWTSPAGTVTINASFEPGEGTASKPVMVYNPEEMTRGELWGNDATHYSAYGVGGMLMNFRVGMGAATLEIGGTTYDVVPGEWIQIPVVSMNPRMPVDFAVKCNDEYVSYEFYFSYPVGHMNNPHFPTMGKKNTINIEAGSQGHYIRWQATGSGFLEFTMNTKTGWTYVINNLTTGVYGDMHWSDDDPIATKSYVAVTEGDIIDIIVNTYDPENPWTAPEGTIAFTPKLITAYKSEVVSGKSLTLKYINTDNGKTVTNSKVTWELYMYERDEWGDIVLDENWQKVKKPVPAEIATIKAGKLTTAAGIADATEIVVEATYGETKNFYNITIRPAASSLRLELTENNHMTDESTVIENANGQTVNWILNHTNLSLKAITDPDGASEKVTVKSSNTNILKVAVDNEGNCYLQPVWNAKKMSYGSGKVTVTVTTADGSNKKATITFNISTLADEVSVLPKNNQWIVASGKTLNMIANVSTYATNKAVDWSVVTAAWDENMGHYVERPDLDPVASISAKGVLTANKNLKEAAYVIVKATAKDGGGAMGTAVITVAPAAKKVEINAPAEHDINNGTEIFISGKAISADGAFETADLKWTISNKKVASGFYYGTDWNEETWTEEEGIYLQLTGKTGKVTLTATATDGSKVSAKATVNVVKSPSVVELNMHSAYLAAGKSLTLKATVGAETYDVETDTFVLDPNVTDKTVTWDAKVVEYAEVTDDWGDTYVDFVEVEDVDLGLSIKGGKLTVNKKKFDAYFAETGEWAFVKVTATAKMTNAWGETVSDHCIVNVTPATNKVNIVRTTIDNVVTGKTLTIDDDATLVLGAIPNPLDAAGMFTWKSSNTKVATVVENRDGSVTVKPAGKLGTATITATAADGSGKSAKVTVKVISKVDSLTIDTSSFALAGTKKGKSFDLNKLLTIAPANASNKKVTWSIADWDAEIAKENKITLSSTGKLTAKMAVTEPVTFTVIAKAADGLGAVAYAELTVTPAATKVNILVNGEAATGTQEVAVDGELVVSAASDSELAANLYTWKTSNAKVAKIVENEDGTVSVIGVKTGTAKITVTAADGSGVKATITVKVVKKNS